MASRSFAALAVRPVRHNGARCCSTDAAGWQLWRSQVHAADLQAGVQAVVTQEANFKLMPRLHFSTAPPEWGCCKQCWHYQSC